MRLTSQHFETIVAVIDAGSVGDAAELLAISQSAVSHRIAEAERRLGVDLFIRRPSRVLLPTPAGLTLYQGARRALPELARAEHDVVRSAGDAFDVVRIGVGSYDCYHWFAPFQAVVRDRLPEALLQLAVVGDSPVEQLNRSAVDLVLAPGNPTGAAHSVPLFDDELVLLVHPEHPAAGTAWVGPDVMDGEAYLTYNIEPVPGFEFERFVDPAVGSPSTVTVIEQTGAIAEMVAAGLGISILSRWAVTPWLNAGSVVAVPCGRDGLALSWVAVMRSGTPERGVEASVARLLAEWLTART